jgi:hypothetical protein
VASSRPAVPAYRGAVLFEQRFREPVADGSVTVTFRRWKKHQVKAGNRYRTPIGMIGVEAVDIVDESAIAGEDIARAGYESADALIADLRGTPELAIYRVRFHAVAEPDPRDALAADADLSDDDLADLDRRLERLDRSSSWGPWTLGTLRAIDANPGLRAGDLADGFGREKEPFKLDVRKLKSLGLTISLEVGYRLSPRGRAYLVRTTRGSEASAER